MKFFPIIPAWITILIFALITVLTILALRRAHMDKKRFIVTVMRFTAIYILVLIIGLRPMIAKEDGDYNMRNLDVIFVVDTTPSMWAQDYNGSTPRIEGAQKHIEYITHELSGSHFAVLCFDNFPYVVTPFTQDAQHVRNMVKNLNIPEHQESFGSDLSAPQAELSALLDSAARNEDRKTIVFFLSDGEITNNAEMLSYADLHDRIDGGAVMGYGSTHGGEMYIDGEYITDPATQQRALSYIDEKNLTTLAKDLGLTYFNVNDGDTTVHGMTADIKKKAQIITEELRGLEMYEDTYYYAAGLLAILILIDLVTILRTRRVQ